MGRVGRLGRLGLRLVLGKPFARETRGLSATRRPATSPANEIISPVWGNADSRIKKPKSEKNHQT